MKTAFYFILILLFTTTASSCATTVKNTPSKVVVIKKLPRTHKIVRIKGVRYYKFNGKHYRKTRKGYVVVRV
ncbi:hypothetical protein SAMN05444411_101130 [Lutibacter oricola]|uniref:Uncharacterized protein n=1 Tax=Lutibacter oricola TaxID=762486 RepID=A0A1H2R2J3_9FLAO|nr:DUF6515 family protein [Lutibacter oricola]SDW13418.1 hypothetical protein SAMN05444411_101130 [Lutibacter oricola]